MVKERGPPKETWRRTFKRERQDLGFQSWTDATRVAKERDKWSPDSSQGETEIDRYYGYGSD